MARRGGRVDFSSLVGVVEDSVANDQKSDGQFRANVPLHELVANPRNPRDDLGDLQDLATITERQLQPGTVVGRIAWLNLWPEDETVIGSAKWIVVNGCRRLAACAKFGRTGMDVVVRDSIAASKELILWAAIVENIDRRDFDVIEEARAVELMVVEVGSADSAAQRLGKSKGWVSQRRSLLKLEPELQDALRAGDLAVRLARSLAQVPREEQVAAWKAAQVAVKQKEEDPATDSAEGAEGASHPSKPREPVTAAKIVKTLHTLGSDPQTLAEAMRSYFTTAELEKFVAALAPASLNS